MDLLITERGRTHSAYLNGEEWTDYGTFEANLDGLRGFLHQTKNRESRQMTIRDGDPISIDFVSRAGIILSQILIDYNPSDHDQLLARLGEI